jgi:8-oxo-dGTP diphosphatase
VTHERDDWSGVRCFGTGSATLPLVIRPSAYALTTDAGGRLAVVRAPDGVFLPGGGMDPGETPQQTLAREAREECGWDVIVHGLVERAVQIAVAGDGSVCYEKRSYFFSASIRSTLDAPLEPGHATLWLPPAEAAGMLKHESHAWVVERFAADRNAR